MGSVYLCQVRKEDLAGASSQNVPVTSRHHFLTVFFEHLWGEQFNLSVKQKEKIPNSQVVRRSFYLKFTN